MYNLLYLNMELFHSYSNICSRTSRQIRLALPQVSPEMLSTSSKKDRRFSYSMHLALFIWMDDTITCTNASVNIVI